MTQTAAGRVLGDFAHLPLSLSTSSAFCKCPLFGTASSARLPESRTAAYWAPSVPTPDARRWSIEDLLALDNGALDHPPSHEEWNYR